MEDKPPTANIYEFGDFRLDGSQLMLYRGDEEILLPPKAVETLLALVVRRGQIVSKDELMDSIWVDSVVEESNLSRYIHMLRSTLGALPDGRPYIETYRRRGYRFNAEVAERQYTPKVTVSMPAFSFGSEPGRAIREGTTGNVIAVAEWRRNTQEAENTEAEFDVVPDAVESKVPVFQRWFVLPAAVIVLAGIAAVVYFSAFRSSSPLTNKDVILIADFENRTGDAIFDSTLRQGLSIHLQQSPFLSLFPDERMRNTLKLMRRSPEEKITREIAREICQRQGLKAFIVGNIYGLGETYVLTLETVDAETTQVIASEQEAAEGKEQVLKALALAASGIRGKLGESLASIPVPEFQPWKFSTSSLDALRMMTFARKEARVGNWEQAIAFTIKAIELDPDFAMGYRMLSTYYLNDQQVAHAANAIRKAYDLRDHAPEYERLHIEMMYHRIATGEWDKVVEAGEMIKALYPRDFMSNGTLAELNVIMGRYAMAVEEATAGIEKGAVVPFSTKAYSLAALGRFDEARAAVDQGLALGHENFWMRKVLADLAFISGDETSFEEQLDKIQGGPSGYWADAIRGHRALYFGQTEMASELLRKAAASAKRQNASGPANRFSVDLAQSSAFLQRCEHTEISNSKEPFPHAMCGDAQAARVSLEEMLHAQPNATMVKGLYKPLYEAALEYRRGNYLGTIDKLQPIQSHLEIASEFRVTYIRGQALLRLRKGPEAALQFQKILDHRGEAPFSPLYPLAYLGIARARALTGDLDASRAAYEQFLEIWKDADNDLPELLAARAEYKKLVQGSH